VAKFSASAFAGWLLKAHQMERTSGAPSEMSVEMLEILKLFLYIFESEF
jgi:hypothetical protein